MVTVRQSDLPDPTKLELLAEWFDAYDRGLIPHEPGVQRGQEVQKDLRRWAAALRSVLEAPGEQGTAQVLRAEAGESSH